jgi:DNA-binding Lrp family transcriptional regulator
VASNHTITDPIDRSLLDRLQSSIPCLENPFAEIGAELDLDETDVIARIRRLKEEKIIRQVSAIFDTRSLGYASSLVAARIPPDRVEEAAAAINRHPGVSHNYLRNHDFNLWYTIAVAPTSKLGLEGTVDILHRQSGAESTRLLPTLRLFKIGVRFDMGGSIKPAKPAASFSERNRSDLEPLSAEEIAFVRTMQRDLALTPQPFVEAAAELGIAFTELAEMHGQFLSTGRMRRFAAVLHHRKAGFRANAMGVWAGPAGDEAELHRLGEIMAGFPAVSHCYQRPSYPDWPYNLFTMVHGRSEEECEQVLADIAAQTGITERLALYSSREFKKVRVRYFTDEEAAWESSHH